MESIRISRSAACFAIALTLFGAATPAIVGGISLPPAPPPPGWTQEATMRYPGSGSITSMAASPDGPLVIATLYDTDTVTFDYNITLWMRANSAWYTINLATAANGFYSPSTLSSAADDRAGIVTFAATYGGPMTAYVAFVTNSGSYGSPLPISDTPTIGDLWSAVTPAGNYMAAWTYPNSTTEIWANRSADGSGFDGAVRVATTAGPLYAGSLVSIGPDDFLMVWWEYDAPNFMLRSSTYTSGSGWSAPRDVAGPESGFDGLVGAGSVAGRAAFASWVDNGTSMNLTAFTYSAAGGWAQPTVLDQLGSPSYDNVFPVVAMDGRGVAHIAWGQGSGFQTVRTLTWQMLDPAAGWSAPWQANASSPGWITMSAAPDGNASLAWFDAIRGGHELVVARYVPGSGVRPLERVDEAFSPSHDLSYPTSTIANRGNFTAVWMNTETDARSLVARDFVAGNDPPALSISAPSDASHVTQPTVEVSGQTSPNATVEVNGALATVAADGSYSIRVALESGSNAIDVRSTDKWHNFASASITVTFDDPVPALEADLAAAQANVSAAQAASSQAAADAAAAKQQATQIQGANADLQNQLNLTKTQLNETQGIVQHQQTDLDFLKAHPSGAASSDSTALIVGVLGAGLGAAGLGLSLMRPRGGAVGSSPTLKGASTVENPSPSSGGSDSESTADAKKDEPQTLSGRDR